MLNVGRGGGAKLSEKSLQASKKNPQNSENPFSITLILLLISFISLHF